MKNPDLKTQGVVEESGSRDRISSLLLDMKSQHEEIFYSLETNDHVLTLAHDPALKKRRLLKNLLLEFGYHEEDLFPLVQRIVESQTMMEELISILVENEGAHA